MGRKKKEGKREKGVWGKQGFLYVIIPKKGKAGQSCWVATSLEDKPENIKKAVALRESLLNKPTSCLDANITVEEFVFEYVKRKERTSAVTVKSTNYYRGKRIAEFYEEKKVKSMTKEDVEDFLDDCFEPSNPDHRKCCTRTVNDYKAFFQNVMDMAVEEGLIISNPVREAVLNKELEHKNMSPNKDDDFFSYYEAMHFLEIVKDHPLRDLFYTMLFFGLRREEVLGIRWSCVDLINKRLIIAHTVVKGLHGVCRDDGTKTLESADTFPLTDEQVEMFKRIKHKEDEYRALFGNSYFESDYVFKHEDGSLYYPDYPTDAFRKVIKRNPDLPQGITVYGLRASCISILVHAGADIKSIQAWARHKDIQTTLKYYAKVKEKENKQQILEKMSGLIDKKI